ncbi:MAG: cobalamin B12-binding domain-containing protein [Archaeoglobaceae archaeon]|nr:cobalamin B12-binding domain-containing protein [Archaeoglobaceae archaeon]MCX8152306.1 cobalamin B12-binding domain-containing protein [Archaeoglobaceae archaeon]MDW8013984.1 cobalamin B12-binding domain-containing protein [Archaeoglobaceae archaeon]
MEEKKIRVVLAKVGLDGHDRGVKVLARFLRDAGFEVIYTGLHRTPQEVARAAVDEDADVVGISLHSGAHMTLVPKTIQYIKEYGGKPEEMLILVGGIIPNDDIPKLKELGVDEIFIPGTPISTIIEYIRENLKKKKGSINER